MDKPAIRLLDVLKVLFPEKADRLEKDFTDFYSDRESRAGEFSVSRGTISHDELAMGLIQQKAELGRLTECDKQVLHEIYLSSHQRAMTSLDEMALLAGRKFKA